MTVPSGVRVAMDAASVPMRCIHVITDGSRGNGYVLSLVTFLHTGPARLKLVVIGGPVCLCWHTLSGG